MEKDSPSLWRTKRRTSALSLSFALNSCALFIVLVPLLLSRSRMPSYSRIMEKRLLQMGLVLLMGVSKSYTASIEPATEIISDSGARDVHSSQRPLTHA